MKPRRKIIRIDEAQCDGCGLCVPSCAEGALKIIDGKARLVSDSACDGLGACLGECPQGALQIIEREADEFIDPGHGHGHEHPQPEMPCGCPSSFVRMNRKIEKEEVKFEEPPSALSHWPIQLRLVPPRAPFLKGAELLIAADCTPGACPSFHREFLKDKSLVICCPKLDDQGTTVNKLAAIFAASGIKTITALVMEVPCCQSLLHQVNQALTIAKIKIPVAKVTIGINGEVIEAISCRHSAVS